MYSQMDKNEFAASAAPAAAAASTPVDELGSMTLYMCQVMMHGLC